MAPYAYLAASGIEVVCAILLLLLASRHEAKAALARNPVAKDEYTRKEKFCLLLAVTLALCSIITSGMAGAAQ